MNSVGTRTWLSVGELSFDIHRLDRVDGATRLPYSLEVLLENPLRNEDDDIHAECKMDFLASRPLVIAYASTGTMRADKLGAPLGAGPDGAPVYLRDTWHISPAGSMESLGLTSEEIYAVTGLTDADPLSVEVTVHADRAEGSTAFTAVVRIDTPTEAAYFRHGGILRSVLRQLLGPDHGGPDE